MGKGSEGIKSDFLVLTERLACFKKYYKDKLKMKIYF
jgi:hypothetical protein